MKNQQRRFIRERNTSLDTLKGKIPTIDLHPIHLGIHVHFIIIAMHVLTMDIELQIARDISRVLIEDFHLNLSHMSTERQYKILYSYDNKRDNTFAPLFKPEVQC